MKIFLLPLFALLCGMTFLICAGGADGQTRPAPSDGPGLEETEPATPTPVPTPVEPAPENSPANITGEALVKHIEALEKKAEKAFDAALCRQLVLLHLSSEKYVRALYWLKKIEENNKVEELDRLVRLYIDNQLGVLGEDGKSRAPKDWAELGKFYEQRFAPPAFRVKKALFVKLPPGEAVNAFGQYEEVKEAVFAPGDRIAVYVEVENHRCVRDNPEQFSVRLVTNLKILTNLGVKLWEDAHREPLSYTAKSEPRDMFFTSFFILPAELKRVGTYVLQIKVTDLNAPAPVEATRQLTFSVK